VPNMIAMPRIDHTPIGEKHFRQRTLLKSTDIHAKPPAILYGRDRRAFSIVNRIVCAHNNLL
jgi:hypothetical protein